MSSLSDILTAAKNIVTALNNAAQTYLNVNGTQIAPGLSATTQVSIVSGRLATLSIIVGGSASGVIYDARVTTDTSRPLYNIPTTPGIVYINMPVVNGIVVAPGTGQVVAVSYS